MEINGIILAKLPLQSGVSQRTGNTWVSQSYILETEGNHPKKIPFEVFGEDKIKRFNIQNGEKVTIQFDIEGSEWNNKWFVKVKCYNIIRVQQSKPAPIPQTVIYPDKPQPAPQPQPQQSNNADDLPF